MSILVGHFVLSPREMEKTDRKDSRGDERVGQGTKRKRNESEETEEIKNIPHLPLPVTRMAGLPNCKPISAGCPGCVRYTTPSSHLTTPSARTNIEQFQNFQLEQTFLNCFCTNEEYFKKALIRTNVLELFLNPFKNKGRTC